MRFAFFTVCAVAATLASAPAWAAAESGSFGVSVTVENACEMDAAAKVQVHCSTDTPYALSVGTPRTVAAYRAMTSDSGVTIDTITY